MDIIEIREKYNNGEYTSQIKIPKMVASTHIFDENLSVVRNREMVIEYNSRVQACKINKRNEQEKLNAKFANDVIDYIVEEYNLNRNQADYIHKYAYAEKDSSMNEYFEYVEEILEVVDSVLRLSDTK